MDVPLDSEDVEVFNVRHLPDDPVTGANLPSSSGTATAAHQGFEALPDIQVLDLLRHFHPHRVEAVALVFLCMPYPNIRALAIEILQSVRSITVALSEVTPEEVEGVEEEVSLAFSLQATHPPTHPPHLIRRSLLPHE